MTFELTHVPNGGRGRGADGRKGVSSGLGELLITSSRCMVSDVTKFVVAKEAHEGIFQYLHICGIVYNSFTEHVSI